MFQKSNLEDDEFHNFLSFPYGMLDVVRCCSKVLLKSAPKQKRRKLDEFQNFCVTWLRFWFFLWLDDLFGARPCCSRLETFWWAVTRRCLVVCDRQDVVCWSLANNQDLLVWFWSCSFYFFFSFSWCWSRCFPPPLPPPPLPHEWECTTCFSYGTRTCGRLLDWTIGLRNSHWLKRPILTWSNCRRCPHRLEL